MERFANLADAGARLGERLAQDPGLRSPGLRSPGLRGPGSPRALLLAAVPNGVPVALAAAPAVDGLVVGLPVTRDDDGARIDLDLLLTRLAAVGVDGVSGQTVLVVDDGVETGTVARAASNALGPLGPARLVLAVPVCSRQAMADLALRYDDVIAVRTPLGRQALSWHFDDFDTIDEPTALALLDQARDTPE